MTKEIVGIVRSLAGTVCACGRMKVAKQSFCQKCYFVLPKPQRMALYRRLDDGYPVAYSEALETLRSLGVL